MSTSMDISIRRDSWGGRLRAKVLASHDTNPNRSRLLLLVHGFNVTEDSADSTYAKFESAVLKLAPTLSKDIGRIFWPGDERIYQLFSPLWFPSKISIAVQGAVPLARWISQACTQTDGTPIPLTIFAHSLGCRLVLETLFQLTKLEPKGRKVTAVLMAAAVPENYIRSEQSFQRVKDFYPDVSILFSSEDSVLKHAFPIGSAISEPKYGLYPQAVGLRGRPPVGFRSRSEMYGFGHGSYWVSNEVHRLASMLSGHPRGKILPERTLPGINRTLQERFFNSRAPAQRVASYARYSAGYR